MPMYDALAADLALVNQNKGMATWGSSDTQTRCLLKFLCLPDDAGGGRHGRPPLS